MKIKKLFFALALALVLTLGLLISFTLAAPGNPDPEPDPNTHTAPPTTTVALSYDEAMDAATVTSHTFAVHAFQTGLLPATHGVQGHTILVTPTRPFHAGELVQTTATTRTLSITGEQPLSYTVWGFRAAVDGGSGLFTPHPVTPTFGGGNSYSVVLGDLDGDGDLDAVVQNGSSQLQDVYLNNGGKGFYPHPISPTFGSGNSIDAVTLGDVDGDGDLDAVAASWGAAHEVYLNVGGGVFRAHSTFGAGEMSTDIALGDMDGDGDLDAVIASTMSFPQNVCLNDGDGSFDSCSTFGAGNSEDVALGDVDGDGDLDVVVANDASAAQDVCLNEGDGSFDSCSTFGAGRSNAVALGDVDGDGDLDAVVANWGQPQDVCLNDGDGSFDSCSTFGAGDSKSVALGDVDGDGDLDAVVANIGVAQDVCLNNGNGVFDSCSTFGAGDSSDVALGDLDGDGDLDAVVANDSGQAQTVWLNQATVTDVTPTPNSHDAPLDADIAIITSKPISHTSVSSRTVFVHGGYQGHVSGLFSFGSISFDPDGDWFPGELVQTSVTTGVLDSTGLPIIPYVWEFRTATQSGSGAFAPHPVTPTFGATDGDSYDVALGDLDGDGDLDAVVANLSGQAQDVYLNDGGGGLVQHPVSSTFGGGDSYAIALGDLDGDGDLDALVANDGAAQDVYLNDGSGSFPISYTFDLTASTSTAIALGDVDGDGDLDAVVANAQDEAQEVYLNDGSGLLAQHPVAYTFGAGRSQAVALGDVDGDGDLDAVVANYLDQPQEVYLNDGSGLFTQHPVTHTFGAGNSRAVALGDLDGDGDLDAVVANDWAAAEQVYLNDGEGVFTSTFSFGAGNSWDVALGDVDGDGDLDALVANADAQAQDVYLNDGSGIFTSAAPFGAGDSRAVALGDLDGDGDLDAVVANAGTIQGVWLNCVWVTSVTPTPNSHDVSLDASLAITTAAPISPTSVTSRTVFVHGGFQGHVSGLFSFGAPVEPTDILFDPGGDWFPGELVQTSVSTGVLDSDGLPIAPYVWEFRTATQGGSGAFAAHPVTPSISTVSASGADVALGDVDGDGDLDAVIANSAGQSQETYLNDGGGGLVPHPISPTFGLGSQSTTIVLGDVDGDGDLDAVVANWGQPQDVYLNDGGGAFASPPISGTFGPDGYDEGVSFDLALGDVDGDGDLDAVVANRDRAQDVYLNDGAGVFTAHPITSTFGTVEGEAIALGDVDGDGDLDVTVANYDLPGSHSGEIYLNDGSGVFHSHPISPTYGTNYGNGATLGDLDGDGDLDAIIASYGSTRVYLNDGSGGFTQHPIMPTFGTGCSDIVLGDVDGDGDLDAVIARGGAEEVYLNDGSGGFSGHPFVPTFGGDDSTAVALGDLDGDGDLDAVVANDLTAQSSVWLNRGWVTGVAPAPNSHDAPLDASVVVTTNTPVSSTSITSRTLFVHGGFQGHARGVFSLSAPGEPASIHFDPDGDWFPGELVQTSVSTNVLGSSGLSILRPYVWGFRAATQGGSGVFSPHPSLPTFGAGNSEDVTLGDVDGDGDLDAVVANDGNQAQDVYLNDGGGGFYSGSTFGAGASLAVALGDVDGDGDLDAVVANDGGQAQDVYLNDGGAFTEHPSSPFGAGQSYAVALGDVDGDGDLDAIVANWGAAQDVYLNDGGAFTGHPISPTFGAGNSTDVALGDLDDDGDLDAVVANRDNQAQDVYLNDGAGGFTAHPISSTFGAGESYAVALGDVDGDGDLDAVVANYGAAQDVYLNDGGGGFYSGSTFGAGESTGVALEDVDGDGDLDAIVANWDQQAQDVYLNDGDGVFTPHPDSSTFGAGASSAVALGDVDGDGDLDALVANYGAAQEVWLNRSRADLSIAKTVEPDLAAPGAPFTYTLTFANDGPNAASHIVISDSVPVSVIGVSDAWLVGSGEITRTAGVTFEWTVSRLGPGEGGVITITGWLSDALPHDHTFTNTATITGMVVDSGTLNNEGAASITVDAQAPDAPVLLSPADGALINDATPTLTWQASAAPDLAGYLLDFDGAVSDVGDVTESTTALLADGAYTWTVAAYDAVDNTSAYTDTWSFTVDATPPQVTGFSPADEAQDVALDAAVIITFSEAISTPTFAYDVLPDPGGWSVAWSEGDTLVTLEHDDLAYNTTYTVTVSAADDLAGNPLEGAPLVWSFVTFGVSDTVSPQVVAVSPPDEAQEVAIDAVVVITFSEAISTTSLAYDVTPDPGGWSVIWSGGDVVATLEHNDWTCSTTYTVTISAAYDLAGNPLEDAPYVWSFVTAPSRLYLPLVLKSG